MKIAIINASQRGNKGNTQILIDKLCTGIKKTKSEYEIIFLNEEKIEICKACDACHSNQQESNNQCIINDDLPKIFDLLSKSDLVIYAFPIYSFHFPAKLKAIFERMYSLGDNLDLTVSEHGLVFHQIDKSICRKPYALLINYGNIEPAAVRSSLEYFKSFSRFTDAKNIGTLQRNTMRVISDSIKSDKKSVKTESIFNAYEQAGFEIGTYGKITKKTQKAANQEVIPLPLIKFLKHLRVRWFKKLLVKIAKNKKQE